MLHDQELRYVHVRPFGSNKGGMTLAYSTPARKGDKMIYVAAATCSPKDTYCKKVGRELAAAKFVRGETIQIATTRHWGLGHQLKYAFQHIMRLGQQDHTMPF